MNEFVRIILLANCKQMPIFSRGPSFGTYYNSFGTRLI